MNQHIASSYLYTSCLEICSWCLITLYYFHDPEANAANYVNSTFQPPYSDQHNIFCCYCETTWRPCRILIFLYPWTLTSLGFHFITNQKRLRASLEGQCSLYYGEKTLLTKRDTRDQLKIGWSGTNQAHSHGVKCFNRKHIATHAAPFQYYVWGIYVLSLNVIALQLNVELWYYIEMRACIVFYFNSMYSIFPWISDKGKLFVNWL